MYGSFEDFARYANDREMDTFGTQEFFDYHNAKRVADAGGGIVESLAEFGVDNPVLQGLANAASEITEYLRSIGGPKPGLPPYTPSVTRYPALRMDGSYNMGGEEVIPYDLPPQREPDLTLYKAQLKASPSLANPPPEYVPTEMRYPSLRMGGGYEPGGEQFIPEQPAPSLIDGIGLQMSPTLSVPADGVPPDLAPLLKQSMGPVGEGVKVAAAATGAMPGVASDQSPGNIDYFYKSKPNKFGAPEINDISASERYNLDLRQLPDAALNLEPKNLQDVYRIRLGDGLIAIGFSERAARLLAYNIMGAEGRVGLGDFEPTAVATEGAQAIIDGIQTGDKSKIAWGVVDVLTAGVPFYGKAAARTVKSLVNDIGDRFGEKTAVYHGPRVEYGPPLISELPKYKGADAQGFGFYVTPDPVQALGHSHTFNVKQGSLPNKVIPTLLDRAAPLDQQGKGVLEKLERGLKKVPDDHPFAIALNAVKSGDGYNSVRGSQFYNKLSEEFGKQVPGNAGDKRRAGQELASTYLGSLGIPGASEGGGKMFIVWDQKLLDKMKWGKTQPDIDKALITPGGLARPGYNKPAGEAAATKDKERK